MDDADDEKLPTAEDINSAAIVDPDALKRWGEISPDAFVVLRATRTDFDHLLLGLRLLTFAQGDAMAAFQLHTNGDAAEAKVRFESAIRRHFEALKGITTFTSSMMAKAEVDG